MQVKGAQFQRAAECLENKIRTNNGRHNYLFTNLCKILFLQTNQQKYHEILRIIKCPTEEGQDLPPKQTVMGTNPETDST